MIATYRAHADSYDAIQQALPTPDESRIAATVLMITACQDNQLSLDGSSHGVFTGTLLAVWDGGAWGGGGYGQFYEAIRAKMPDSQQPSYMRVGPPHPTFEHERPFTIG